MSRLDAVLIVLKGMPLGSLYILPILLFSIVVHEIAHGWMALKLGDSTAYDSGRLTFNPIPHIDPIGSIAVPLLSVISAGSVFIAWAKPVPVNPSNFRNFRRDDILVSIAGPLSNLLVALFCVAAYIVSVYLIGHFMASDSYLKREFAAFFIKMFFSGITLNLFLAVFNLIPVPPLDGSHVLSSLLPQAIGERYQQIGFFGILFVILLMRLEPVRYALVSVVLTLQIPYDMLISIFL